MRRRDDPLYPLYCTQETKRRSALKAKRHEELQEQLQLQLQQQQQQQQKSESTQRLRCPQPAAAKLQSRWHSAPIGRCERAAPRSAFDSRMMCRGGHSAVLASDAGQRRLVIFGGLRKPIRERSVAQDHVSAVEWLGGDSNSGSGFGSLALSACDRHQGAQHHDVDDPHLHLEAGLRARNWRPAMAEREYLNDVHVFNVEEMCWDHPDVRGSAPCPRHSHSAVWLDPQSIHGREQEISSSSSSCSSSSESDCDADHVHVHDGHESAAASAVTFMHVLKAKSVVKSRYRKHANRYMKRANRLGRGGFMVVVGGEDERGQALSDIYVLRLGFLHDKRHVSWRWSEINLAQPGGPVLENCMPRRSHHAAALIDGQCFIFGGRVQRKHSDAFGGSKSNAYDTYSDLWRLNVKQLLCAGVEKVEHSETTWENVDAVGSAPSPRWGHAMLATCATRPWSVGTGKVTSGLWPHKARLQEQADSKQARGERGMLIVGGGNTSCLHAVVDVFCLELGTQVWSRLSIDSVPTVPGSKAVNQEPLARFGHTFSLVQVPQRLSSSAGRKGGALRTCPVLVMQGGRYVRRRPARGSAERSRKRDQGRIPQQLASSSSRQRSKLRAFGDPTSPRRSSRKTRQQKLERPSNALSSAACESGWVMEGQVVRPSDATHCFDLHDLRWRALDLVGGSSPEMRTGDTDCQLLGKALAAPPKPIYGHVAAVDGSRLIIHGGWTIRHQTKVLHKGDHAEMLTHGLLRVQRETHERALVVHEEMGHPLILDFERSWLRDRQSELGAAGATNVEQYIANERAEALKARFAVRNWAASAWQRRVARQERRHARELRRARRRMEHRLEAAERARMAVEDVMSDLLRPPLASELGPDPIQLCSQHDNVAIDSLRASSLSVEWALAEGRAGQSRYCRGKIVKCWLDGTYDVQYTAIRHKARRISVDFIMQLVEQQSNGCVDDSMVAAALAKFGEPDGSGRSDRTQESGAQVEIMHHVPRSLLRRPGQRWLGSAGNGVVGTPVRVRRSSCQSTASYCGSSSAATSLSTLNVQERKWNWGWEPLQEGNVVEMRVHEAALVAEQRKRDNEQQLEPRKRKQASFQYRYTNTTDDLTAASESDAATAAQDRAFAHTSYILRMSRPGHDLDTCEICRLGSLIAAGQRASQPDAEADDQEAGDRNQRHRTETIRRALEARRTLAGMSKDKILSHALTHFDVVAFSPARAHAVLGLVPSHVLDEERRKRAGFQQAWMTHKMGSNGSICALGDEQVNLVGARTLRGLRSYPPRQPTALFGRRIRELLQTQKGAEVECGSRQGHAGEGEEQGQPEARPFLTPAGTPLCLRGLSMGAALQQGSTAGGNGMEFGFEPVALALEKSSRRFERAESGRSRAVDDNASARRAFHVCYYDSDAGYMSYPGTTVVFHTAARSVEDMHSHQNESHESRSSRPKSAVHSRLLQARLQDERLNERMEPFVQVQQPF